MNVAVIYDDNSDNDTTDDRKKKRDNDAGGDSDEKNDDLRSRMSDIKIMTINLGNDEMKCQIT